MAEQTNGEAHRYRIVPIGSASPQGWAIECDGKLSRSGHRFEVLAAWLDAILGAREPRARPSTG